MVQMHELPEVHCIRFRHRDCKWIHPHYLPASQQLLHDRVPDLSSENDDEDIKDEKTKKDEENEKNEKTKKMRNTASVS